MIIKTLYRQNNIVSLIEPEGEYTTLYRVIADEGKLITLDGENLYQVIDTEVNEGWIEIRDPNYEDATAATEYDYLVALGELGVE